MTFVVTVTSVFVRTIIHQIAFFGRGNLENNIYSYIFSLFFTFILNYIFLEHLFLLLTAGDRVRVTIYYKRYLSNVKELLITINTQDVSRLNSLYPPFCVYYLCTVFIISQYFEVVKRRCKVHRFFWNFIVVNNCLLFFSKAKKLIADIFNLTILLQWTYDAKVSMYVGFLVVKSLHVCGIFGG